MYVPTRIIYRGAGLSAGLGLDNISAMTPRPQTGIRISPPHQDWLGELNSNGVLKELNRKKKKKKYSISTRISTGLQFTDSLEPDRAYTASSQSCFLVSTASQSNLDEHFYKNSLPVIGDPSIRPIS